MDQNNNNPNMTVVAVIALLRHSVNSASYTIFSCINDPQRLGLIQFDELIAEKWIRKMGIQI